jgi:hypothetical protein
VRPAGRPEHRRQVADVAADHFELAPVPRREGKVGARAGREVIEHAHARLVHEEPLHEMRADEPGAARHEREI